MRRAAKSQTSRSDECFLIYKDVDVKQNISGPLLTRHEFRTHKTNDQIPPLLT